MKTVFIFVVACLWLTAVQAQELLRQQTFYQTETAGSVSDRAAIDQIAAHNTVEPGAQAHYAAGQAVTLHPGFTAQAGSVFRATIGLVSANTKTIRPEIEFSARAYPNPFQQTTTIEYVLPQAGQVSFTLVDEQGHVLGQDTSHREGGRQERNLTGTNLTEGIYFYQIRSDGQQRIIRLIKTP